jgi:hypothetical protein
MFVFSSAQLEGCEVQIVQQDLNSASYVSIGCDALPRYIGCTDEAQSFGL